MTNADRVSTVSQNGDDRLNSTEINEAQAIRAFPQSGHLKSVAGNGTCQEGRRASPLGGFLLLNLKLPYRDNLVSSLRLRRHKIFVPEEHGKTYSDLTDDQIGMQIICSAISPDVSLMMNSKNCAAFAIFGRTTECRSSWPAGS
jgi:hypothetical protein